jgi:hypothetical protein
MANPHTSPLPQEDLPPLGEAGTEYGWPPGMMSARTVATLRGEGITKTSQVFGLARCMTREQWRNFLEGAEHGAEDPQPRYDLLLMWLRRPEILADLRARMPAVIQPGQPPNGCVWRGADCSVTTHLLRPFMRSQEVLDGGMVQSDRVGRTLAAIQDRYRVWRAEKGRALER